MEACFRQYKREALWAWLAQGYPEAVGRYQDARRAAAEAVTETKKQV